MTVPSFGDLDLVKLKESMAAGTNPSLAYLIQAFLASASHFSQRAFLIQAFLAWEFRDLDD